MPENNITAIEQIESNVTDERVDRALGIFANLKALEVAPAAQIGAREILTTIAVRRPKNNEFVQVSSDPAYSLITSIWENRDEGEVYLVQPQVRPAIIAGMTVKLLALAVNQMGSPFIWPVPVDDEQTRKNQWNESARTGYHQAKAQWVKLVGDRAAGLYRVYVAEGELPPPRWPDRSFAELLALGFKGRVIDSENHPVIRSMRGLTP